MIQYPIRSSAGFLGLPNPTWPKAKIALLPIPYDATTSYQSGARFGPETMLAASFQLELFDEEFGFEPCDRLGVYTLDPMELSLDNPRSMLNTVRDTVEKIVAARKLPFLFGGEHSLTFGAVEALYKKHKDFSVLHLDAHMDFRNEFEGTKYNHACVMRRCADLVPVTSVGIRSVAKDDLLEGKKLNHMKQVFYAPEVPLDRILETLPKKVYITIDIDVFDSSIMPSTGTPQPGGLNWYQVLGLVKAVAHHRQVIGADIMEFMPIGGLRAPDFLAAKLTYKMMSYFFLNTHR